MKAFDKSEKIRPLTGKRIRLFFSRLFLHRFDLVRAVRNPLPLPLLPSAVIKIHLNDAFMARMLIRL